MSKLKNRSKHLLFLFLSILFFSQNAFSQAAPTNYEGVMIQGFYWDSYNALKWPTLTSQASEIGEYFDLIWLPPSGKSSGMGYLPVYYFNQNSAFGTQDELKTLIATLKTNGCGAIADIVINHRNGATNWTDFPTETYNGTTYSWGTWAICNDDEVKYQSGQPTPTGAADTGDGYEAARDIDHTNAEVRKTIKAYLQFMKNDMGYIGWRFDYAKGFAPKYFAEYTMDAGCEFGIGEYFDFNYDKTSGFIDGTKVSNEIRCGAFDFPLKEALNKACNNGQWNELAWKRYGTLNQPAGLIHMDGYTRFAYTFVDNHDTWRPGTEYHNNALTNNALAANAFILTQPGIPCVFWDHWSKYKSQIKAMIDARKFVGVHSQSTVEVLSTSSNIYVAKVTGTKGSLIVKVGPGSYSPTGEYTLKTSGDNYAIWTLGGQVSANVNVAVSPESGLYVGGTTVTLTATGDNAPFDIYYTTDGSTPTTSSAKVNSGYSFTVNTATTVSAMAVDSKGNKSSVVSKTYRTDDTGGITVKWKNDQNWSGSIYIYAWDDQDTPLLGQWPGVVVTADETGWYTYSFDRESVNIIFNNGNGNPQTIDIKGVTSSMCYEILSTKTGTGFNVQETTCPVVTLINEEYADKLSIYPNPVADVVYLVNATDVVEVSVIDIKGSRVKRFQSTDVLNVSDLRAGVYFLNIKLFDGKNQFVKLIKK